MQTAYANGASTAFMRNDLGVEVAITPTGVKYLHEEAVRFDIGIYFEANGHGTVLFSESLLQKLHEVGSLYSGSPDRSCCSDPWCRNGSSCELGSYSVCSSD